MKQAASLPPVRRRNPRSPKSWPASRLIVTGRRCWVTLLPLFLTAGLLPLHAQVTIEVVEKADAAGESTDLLSRIDSGAVRGGNVVYSASSREGPFYSRTTIRLNAANAVRGICQ